MRELNVALIGYSFMGKAHSNAYRSMRLFFPDAPAYPRMKVICGRTEAKVKRAAEDFGWDEWSTSYEETVRRDDIDLVDVAAQGTWHAPIAIAAAEAGKAVFCEKPLATTLEDAERMVEAVERAGVKNTVCFNYRRVPAIAFAKKLIDDGFIGRVFHWRAVYLQDWIVDPGFPLVWRLQRAEAGSGSLGDLAAHSVDLAHYLVGDIKKVTGLTETFIRERPVLAEITGGLGAAAGTEMGVVDVDDAALFLARFENGAVGTFEATRFAPGRLNYNSFEINGSNGSIRFNLERLTELEIFNRRDPAGQTGWKTIQISDGANHPYLSAYWPGGHHIGWEHSFVNLVYDLMCALANDTEITPTFRDGLKVQRVLAAVEKSADTGEWVEP